MPTVECRDNVDPLLLDLLAAGQSVVVRARGHSMWPLLRDGDLISVAALHGAARLGDLVVFADGVGCCKAHRVLGRRDCGEGLLYRVRGDSEAGGGEMVEAARIVGVVVAVERDGRSCRLDSGVERMKGLARVAMAACWRPFRRLVVGRN